MTNTHVTITLLKQNVLKNNLPVILAAVLTEKYNSTLLHILTFSVFIHLAATKCFVYFWLAS